MSNSLALCIPAYNAAKFLPKLLESARQQAIPFDEILVYNDCSKDNTSDIAKQYGAKVVEGDVNRGCSTGKNRLAELAKSDWLHFHDADDDLLPNFTTVVHRWINKATTPDIILMHFHYRTADTNELIGEPHYNLEEMKRDPIKFGITNKLVNFAVIKKDPFLRIGGFNLDHAVLYNEDRAFYIKALINRLTIEYEPELTCINYYYPASMSVNNRAKCAKATLHVWEDVIKNTGGKYNREISQQLLDNAAYAATADDWLTVQHSIKAARKITRNGVPGGSSVFRLLYTFFPYTSFYIREKLLRMKRISLKTD